VYLYGTGGLISAAQLGQLNYYYQDASGSTSHIADPNGNLLEWYRYDLQGTPAFYNASDQQISSSANGARHLFTGQQWYSEIGLYDLRNRFYSPDLGRFLQPDPIGFEGDATNLYRYCGNDPVARSDATGTMQNTKADQSGPGDFLDYGYHGGDGTATVYFGLKGYDWSGNELGMLQTEQYYANAPYGTTYTQAMNRSGWGSMGGIVFPRPILKATDAHTGLYGNGSQPGSASFGPVGVIGNLIGKIWTLPNTIIGAIVGIASLPFGGDIDFRNNAIVFHSDLFPSSALTLGNTILTGSPIQSLSGQVPTYYARETSQAQANAIYGYSQTGYGLHEQGHTEQYQLFGPFFLPFYLINQPFTSASPFENAADRYGASQGTWVPGRP
jgi:RHS repeat-associated protein